MEKVMSIKFPLSGKVLVPLCLIALTAPAAAQTSPDTEAPRTAQEATPDEGTQPRADQREQRRTQRMERREERRRDRREARGGERGGERRGPGGPGADYMGHHDMGQARGFVLTLGDGQSLQVSCGEEAIATCVEAAQPLIDAVGATR